MGAGTAWLLTVTGGALANLLEGLLGPPDHRSVGASTAVFAALGAMSAFSWRERLHLPQRWARRWGPLVAGDPARLDRFRGRGHATSSAHVAGFARRARCFGATVALPRTQARADARAAVAERRRGARVAGARLVVRARQLKSAHGPSTL